MARYNATRARILIGDTEDKVVRAASLAKDIAADTTSRRLLIVANDKVSSRIAGKSIIQAISNVHIASDKVQVRLGGSILVQTRQRRRQGLEPLLEHGQCFV